MTAAEDIADDTALYSAQFAVQPIVSVLEAGGPLSDSDRRAIAETLRALVLAPTPMPGQRSAATVAGMARHHDELREMAARFFPEESAATAAEAIHRRLKLYRHGADWRRDRAAGAVDYAHTVRGACWRALKAYNRVLSARRIRAILATSSRAHGQRSAA